MGGLWTTTGEQGQYPADRKYIDMYLISLRNISFTFNYLNKYMFEQSSN